MLPYLLEVASHRLLVSVVDDLEHLFEFGPNLLHLRLGMRVEENFAQERVIL